MNEQWWGIKEPCSDFAIGDDGSLVYGIGNPDYVTLPPELGGGKTNVIGLHIGMCPIEGCDQCVRHYQLVFRIN
jgi:hypothetical protein